MNSTYHEKLGKDNIAELDVGKCIGQRCRAESRDKRMQSSVGVDNIAVVVSGEQRQQTQQTRHIRLSGD